MRVRIDEALQVATTRLEREGIPPEEAQVGARVCLEGELLGRHTHGFRQLRNNIVQYHRGDDRRRAVTIERETAGSALVDGGFHFSYYVHDYAVRLAIRKALATGLALVGVKNGGPSGVLSYYCRLATQSGLICMALNSVPPSVVAPGTTTPLLGSNPIAIGLPRRDADPLLLDLATSAATYNQVLMARAMGTQLPEGVAVDLEGRPTRDPARTLGPDGSSHLLPFGGHKGFGLSFMVELLCSAVIDVPIGRSKLEGGPLEPSGFTGVYLVYTPELLSDRQSYEQSVQSFLHALKSSPRAPDVQSVRLPGEQSLAHRERGLREGMVDIDDDTYVFLTQQA